MKSSLFFSELGLKGHNSLLHLNHTRSGELICQNVRCQDDISLRRYFVCHESRNRDGSNVCFRFV